MKFVAAMVTESVYANALPHAIEALGSSVMASNARIFPTKAVLEPRVADDPTCQYMASVELPPTTLIAALLPVVSVVPIWNTKTELRGAPVKLRVSVPFTCADVEKE